MTLIHKTRPIMAMSILLILAGCNRWLDVKPQNEQPLDEFWNNKEEVLAVVNGSYQQLRSCLNLFVRWGEVRGDAVELGPGLSSNADMLAVKSLAIQPDNSICAWQAVYNAVGRCNCVIKYAPEVLEKDNTFFEETCNAYIAEAVWIRALCYFYLVRTFKDVPFVELPYVDDSRPFAVEKTDGKVILRTVAAQVEAHLPDLPVSYGLGVWENKGKATIWSAYALLADIYLWLEDYGACIEMCRRLEVSDYFSLLPRDSWYRLYYPGNSSESIFELQWDGELDQTNSLFDWFYNESSNNSYAISDAAVAKFNEYEGENDVRASGGSYIEASGKIWKYAGTSTGVANLRESTQRDANWIIYRYADILLLHAEALIMKGQENFQEAYGIILQIRERAGYSLHPDMPVSMNAAIDLVMDERMRELCFEGKRWFDLVRMATREDGKYKEKLISMLLLNVAAKDRPLYQARLQNTDGYYLPVNESDIDASGGVLVQNPYYI